MGHGRGIARVLLGGRLDNLRGTGHGRERQRFPHLGSIGLVETRAAGHACARQGGRTWKGQAHAQRIAPCAEYATDREYGRP